MIFNDFLKLQSCYMQQGHQNNVKIYVSMHINMNNILVILHKHQKFYHASIPPTHMEML
jgi:hypothetical protein